jgi:hypothetical protein
MAMKNLRKYIRHLLIEKGELRKSWVPGMTDSPISKGQMQGVELKKWFRKNADQQSLQKLLYIHWGTPDEILKLLQSWYRGGRKNEINTSIHSPKERLVPWTQDEQWDGDTYTVGIIIKGHVTFASNVDLDTGRLGAYLKKISSAKPRDAEVIDRSGVGYDWPSKSKEFRKRAAQQQKSSGVPKRPDMISLERRFKLRQILDAIDAGNVDQLTEEEVEFLEDHLLDDMGVDLQEFIEMREDGDIDQNEGEAMQLNTRAINKLEDVFILKAEDFDPRNDFEMQDQIERGTLNWPEAIIDNWQPVAIVGEHFEMFQDLAWSAAEYEMPLLDLDLDLYDDFYIEDFEARCEDYAYDDFEDNPEMKEPCEDDDYESGMPWLTDYKSKMPK